MLKKLILICMLITGIPSLAEEIPVTITPLAKISTADKHLQEGDTLEFKDVNTGEIITGIIKELTPNGFAGEQASLVISNFKYKNSDKILNGNICINGSEHKKYQEFANNTAFGITSTLIRGGEITLKPETTKLIVFFEDYVKTEESSIKLKPAQDISTCNDEIEIGDKIKFITIKDVYKNGKLYIKKDTPVYGFVDYVNNNGWSYDNAQVDFKRFKTKTANGDTITLESPVSINGFEILKYKANRPAQFFNYCGAAFRGKEIDIKHQKDNVLFNIWVK